jgi:serine/threonine protein kinase
MAAHLIPTPGSRLGYNTLLQDGPPQNPPDEVFQPPLADAWAAPGIPQDLTVVPFDPQEPPAGIFLVRQQGASQAYARDNLGLEEPDRVLGGDGGTNGGRHPDWGGMYFAVVYPAIPGRPGHFQAPDPQRVVRVAIKCWNRQVVDDHLALLQREGADGENPYREMVFMRELGDNSHVLRPVEFLKTATHIFMITPMGRPLTEEIPLDEPFRDPVWHLRVHELFKQILSILLYLLENGIHHHDLKPENLLFVHDDNGQEVLVAIDFGMAMRIPVNQATHRRSLIAFRNIYGTESYMDPVVFRTPLPIANPLPGYDGVGMDLWAAALILYTLFTGRLLYRRPALNDISYRFYIRIRGLFPPLTDPIVTFLQQLAQFAVHGNRALNVQLEINARQPLHDAIPPSAMELLDQMLRELPMGRLTLAQVIASEFVQDGP